MLKSEAIKIIKEMDERKATDMKNKGKGTRRKQKRTKTDSDERRN